MSLAALLGDRVQSGAAIRACYRTDGGGLIHGVPDHVVLPRSAEDVSKLLRWAQETKTPVVCRGGGLTTEGESVAKRGVLLDLKGLNRLLEVGNGTALVEAGITWHQLAESLRPHGLDYLSGPLNMTSTIGGTLGVGGIDVTSPFFGCSADHATELEVVTPTGEIVRCREGDELFEHALLGYGQYGVITKARMKVRPYRRMSTRFYFYSDIGEAIDDMIRVAQRGEADALAILTLLDRTIALVVGFEDEEKLRAFPGVRGSGELSFALSTALYYAFRPWRLHEARFMLRRKEKLFPALTHPLYSKNGLLEDRAIVFSRLIWKYWGDRQVVIPDLAVTLANLERAARGGIAICRRFFPYFTLYVVLVRKFGDKPRYVMSSIPPSKDDHVGGIEYSPLLEGADYSHAHFQDFKNAIYDLGLEIGGSYYRFGGAMKPYIRRMFGDAVVDRRLATKRKLDPSFILNPDVVF